VSARLKIVQGIESNAELLEPCHGKLVIFDVGVVCDNFDVRVEPLCCLLCYLYKGKYLTKLQSEDDVPGPWIS
jgi:hypothetical protein